MGDKATLIFPSKFTSGNPNKEKELHCLTRELYTLLFSLEGRFYTIAGMESFLSSHLREWECHAQSDCPSIKEYSSSTYCVKIQDHVLRRDEEAAHWDKQALRLFSQRGAIFAPSQWRTDKPLLLANRLVGPLKKNRMGALISLSLSNNGHNVEFWIPCWTFSSY